MSGIGDTPLSKLMTAIREFQAREERPVDGKELRAVIDALKLELALGMARSHVVEEKE